jgi:hypothetical protein
MFGKSNTSPLPTTNQTKSIQVELPVVGQHTNITSSFQASLSCKSRYLELELFKQQFHGKGGLGLRYTYAECNYKVRSYRTIFFGIGFIFLGLALLIFQHNLVFFSTFFGNFSLLTKGAMIGTSLCLSFIAAFIGYSLCVAREASAYLLSKAKRKLFQIYTRKRLEQGLAGLFNFGTFCKKHYSLKHNYQETLHQIEEYKEETLVLLQNIQQYAGVEAHYRELLFNQALGEMYDKMQISLQAFKQK